MTCFVLWFHCDLYQCHEFIVSLVSEVMSLKISYTSHMEKYRSTRAPECSRQLFVCSQSCYFPMSCVPLKRLEIIFQLQCSKCFTKWYICCICKQMRKPLPDIFKVRLHQKKEHKQVINKQSMCVSGKISSVHTKCSNFSSNNNLDLGVPVCKMISTATSIDNCESTMPFGPYSKHMKFSKSAVVCKSLHLENVQFFNAHKEGNGASYLVSLSQFNSGKFATDIHKEDVSVHMLLAQLSMTLT